MRPLAEQAAWRSTLERDMAYQKQRGYGFAYGNFSTGSLAAGDAILSTYGMWEVVKMVSNATTHAIPFP